MKNFKKPVVAMLLFVTTLCTAQINTRGEAINRAGMQRMYVMKMAKNYMSIGAGVKAADASKELEEISTQFNENYNDLVLYAKAKDAKDALAFAGILWGKFREKVNGTPAIDDASSLITEANNLVNACNIVVDKFVANTTSKSAILPNICGRQRLLSQKLGMLYLAKYWQVPHQGLNKEMNETLLNYENGLTSLVNSAENTDEINSILKLQQSEWNFTKKSFDIDSEKMSPTSVYSSTNLMTRNFDRATSMYEKLVLN